MTKWWLIGDDFWVRVNRNSLSSAILESLSKSEDKSLKVNNFNYHSDTHTFLSRSHSHVPKLAVSKAIERLKDHGLIELIDSEQVIIRITDSGEGLYKDSREFETEVENWDGKLRIVLFDIPESKRVVRNLFRRNLKKWGFKNYQRSVWISKRDNFDKVIEYIRYLDIESWVIIFESDRYHITPESS